MESVILIMPYQYLIRKAPIFFTRFKDITVADENTDYALHKVSLQVIILFVSHFMCIEALCMFERYILKG